jgi:nucleoside-diphosphate kinase
MAKQKTLCIIKPDVVEARKQGAVIQLVLDAGFDVVALRQVQLTREVAEAFYAVHRERGFFGELVEFMISGPVVVAALEAEDAIQRYRTLLGATDPKKAEAGTIRALFGAGIEKNAAHGSDSPANGERETAFFFPGFELGN